MKMIKAIYLPDLAFNSKESCIYEYEKGQDFFYMAIDNEIIHDIEPLVEDEDWYIFETELKVNDKNREYGIVKRVPNNELIQYIKEYDKIN